MKTISVPIDPAAAKRLNLGTERCGDLIELTLDGDAFGRLFSTGWVALVNEAARCNIDDFEDEHVWTAEAFDEIAKVTRNVCSEDEEPFRSIMALVEEARKRGTGLHFYF